LAGRCHVEGRRHNCGEIRRFIGSDPANRQVCLRRVRILATAGEFHPAPVAPEAGISQQIFHPRPHYVRYDV
jgi:hypothetical protein